MKVLHSTPSWMPVKTMKMRGSQEGLLFNQSENSLHLSESNLNAIELESHHNMHPHNHQSNNSINQTELLRRLQGQSPVIADISSTQIISKIQNEGLESEYMPCDGSSQKQQTLNTREFIPSKKHFQRRMSMQVLHSSSFEGSKSLLRRYGQRRGSIPCIASADQNCMEPSLKTSQTAPNPFPELIDSPTCQPIAHSRSQSSCIDDRPNSVTDVSRYSPDFTAAKSKPDSNNQPQSVYTSHSTNDNNDNRESVTPNYFSHSESASSSLVNSSSNSSISSTNPLLGNLSAGGVISSGPYSSSPINHYVHSSVIAARAKNILEKCSSPSSSPVITRRISSSSPPNLLANHYSPLVSSSSVDNGFYNSHMAMSNSGYCLSSLGQESSPSDSPNGSTTGRISPDRLSNLYEQSSALWSAQGYTKQMLMVYMDETNYKTVTIEENMVSSDVSQMLVDRCQAIPDKSWSIVEKLPKFNLERSLEDHELVYAIYRSWGKAENNRFLFHKDFKKYELFSNPAQFLPPHMLDWKDGTSPKSSPKLSQKSSERHTNLLFKNLLSDSDRLPDIQGHMYMKDGRKSWKKHFFVLRNSGLYYSAKGNSKEPKHLVLFSHLTDVNIYNTHNAKKVLGSPNNYCICLKPSYCVTDAKELKLLCAEDENSRLSWLAALRLIKYGSQLKENYKKAAKLELKLLKGDSNENSPRPYTSSKLNVKSRVAMDFTGHAGRVVDDPNEAVEVAIVESQHWRKKAPRGHHSPVMADSPCQATGFLSENPAKCNHGLQSGIHMTQPWFHSGITRDEAVQLIQTDGLVDGVFLVRESQSIPGFYVLSLAHNCKVKHCTIKTFDCDDDLYFSMDGGHTKFSDIIQLVEFYQLNANGLPSRLTHYISRVV